MLGSSEAKAAVNGAITSSAVPAMMVRRKQSIQQSEVWLCMSVGEQCAQQLLGLAKTTLVIWSLTQVAFLDTTVFSNFQLQD